MTNLLVLVMTWAYMSRPLSLCSVLYMSLLMVVSTLHEQSQKTHCQEILKSIKYDRSKMSDVLSI